MYGVAGVIAETLEAIFSQTFRDFSVTVVNDGSPDSGDLETVLDPWRSRIRCLKQPNSGPSAARNTGLRNSDSEWVHFLDGDDLVLPDFLEAQMKVLDSRPGLDLVCGDGWIFGHPGFEGGRLSACNSCRVPVTQKSLLTLRSVLFTSAVVARRSKVAEAGGFDPAFRRAEDLDLWLRMARCGARMAYNPGALIRYRMRPGSLCSDRVALVEGNLSVLRKFRASLPPGDPLHGVAARQTAYLEAERARELARGCVEQAGFREAAEHYWNSCRLWPRFSTGAMGLGLSLCPGLVLPLRNLCRRLKSARP